MMKLTFCELQLRSCVQCAVRLSHVLLCCTLVPFGVSLNSPIPLSTGMEVAVVSSVAVAVVTEEVKEQLVEASTVTKKAFTRYRREAEAEEHLAAAEGQGPASTPDDQEGEMSVIITIMQPILRLMQLLCENHNRELQVGQPHHQGALLWFTLRNLVIKGGLRWLLRPHGTLTVSVLVNFHHQIFIQK